MSKRKTFFEMFVGEFVEIIQDFEVTSNINISEGEVTEMRTPMTVTGFVLDSDGEFLFLSQDGEEVSQGLPINSIKHIQIIIIPDPMHELLDELPAPEDDSGFN